jgi:hypothetical protein
MLRRTLLATLPLIVVLSVIPPADALAQCILTNPSFEIGGSGGQVFGGWSQFGAVGSTTEATHGSLAARVTGPDYGGWDVSAFWQRQDCVAGEQWEVTAQVAHSPSNPLTGSSKAIVNIEWRNSSDDIISYESYDAATPATPTGEYQGFSVVSGPAPSGTVAAHFLFAVLQSPTDPPPDVYYDQTTVYSQSYPTIDDQQWGDFNGGTALSFSGRTWRVKGPGYYGPGPNNFTNSSNSVWVDAEDQLHLTVKNYGGTWYSTEVALVEPLGYGDYIFTTVGRLDLLDPNVVFGLFTWQYGPCYDESYLWWGPYNEFDIEFSRWGNAGSSNNAQFVAQPWDWSGNISGFYATFSESEITSHAIRWLHDRVEARSWRGGPNDEAPENMIHTWTYTGPHVPRPEQPRVHLNLWKCCGDPATNQEVVLDAFTFFPDGGTGVVDVADDSGLLSPSARLFAARPNPFNPETSIGYFLDKDGVIELSVYDVSGRLVRTLVSGQVPAGEHVAAWDGRDAHGNHVASGVYLYRLSAGDVLEARRMVLVK